MATVWGRPLGPPVHNARSLQKCFVEIGVEELDWPAQNPNLNSIEHLWYELERRLRARPNHPTSVPDLTNGLGSNTEWKQVPAAMLPHLVESLPIRVEAVVAAKGGTNSILMPMMFDAQVSTYFWSCSVRKSLVRAQVGRKQHCYTVYLFKQHTR